MVDEDDSAGHRDNDVEPQVEVGAPRYAADFLGMPETRERKKEFLLSLFKEKNPERGWGRVMHHSFPSQNILKSMKN